MDKALGRGHGPNANSIYVDGTYCASHPSWDVEDSPGKATAIMMALSRNRVLPATVAEVGCGAGEILRQLQMQLPPETLFDGFDISPQAIAMAKSRENARLRFHEADLTQKPANFDLLLMMDVIEHVEDVFGFLRALRQKSNYKLFKIPLDLSAHGLIRHIPMTHRRTVGHIHYFTKELAMATLSECGYEVLDWFYYPIPHLGTLKQRLVAQARRFALRIAPDPAVLVLGGYCLIVLAK